MDVHASTGWSSNPTTWTWDEIHALPPSTYEGDIHCVTTWSKLGMTWTGVSVDTLLGDRRPLPAATHVVATSHTGYTTNLPLADVTGGKAWVAWEVDGEPLPTQHGGPARLLVPHLYFWKSAKWVAGLHAARPRRAGLLGAQRLPRPRRSLAGAAVPGGLISARLASADSLAAGQGRRHHARDRAREDLPPALPQPVPHRAGQHFVLRLTAPDGYTASRSYSVASPPDDSGEIELTVELLEGGEVSGYLHDVVEVGDELEVRGPIGGWFVWDGDWSRAARRRRVGRRAADGDAAARPRIGKSDLVQLVVSVRSPDDLYYRSEIAGPETTIVYTRVAPPGDGRPAGRLSTADVERFSGSDATFYVCGSAGFAEATSQLLVDVGIAAEGIRVERFGPTG